VEGAHNKPIVVDLDGTLIRTDCLHESVFALLKINPFYCLLLPLWLLRGKAHLKQMIANRAELQVSLFPYHAELLEYLREQYKGGRRLVLATASNERYAKRVAEHLGIFSDVLGSTSSENLSGETKLARIRDLLAGGFAYAGNSSVDMPLWQAADEAVLVNVSPGVRRQTEASTEVVREFSGNQHYLRNLLRAMRPHQWLKNLLLFVPLVLSHQIGNPQLLIQTLLGFLAFCFCASSVYLLNDLLDLASDRQHPNKRLRPFAAGNLPIWHGVIAKLVLLAMAVTIAISLPKFFIWVLGLYYVSTMAYSLWLKRASLIDALVLAGLYTLRLIAGAAAISVAPTFWLLAFSIFLFLSLALIKRHSELQLVHADGRENIVGRAYKSVDTETLAQLGSSSGYLAVLVLALYINSDKVADMYARPEALWILCPMMLYWISRMWLLTRRGEMHDDPVVFTARDGRTWWLALFALIAYGTATYWPQVRPFLSPILD
jgi:4-hydroxybenzoate polyprenyltransferase/phosphoserine phosphatase